MQARPTSGLCRRKRFRFSTYRARADTSKRAIVLHCVEDLTDDGLTSKQTPGFCTKPYRGAWSRRSRQASRVSDHPVASFREAILAGREGKPDEALCGRAECRGIEERDARLAEQAPGEIV